MVTILTSGERKELRKENRPALILGIFLFAGITVTNFTLYYKDVLLGTKGLERPPLIQLVGIELIGLIIGVSTYYLPSKKVIHDLTTNKKHTEEKTVQRKFIKNENGKPEYNLQLSNQLVVSVDRTFYNNITSGDMVKVAFAPASSHIFYAERLTKIE